MRISDWSSDVCSSDLVLTAYQQVQTLKSAVEPAADRALSAARDGYQTGKFDFLNLLDAQRTRFEIEVQLAAALEEYHLARIALTTLVGRVARSEERRVGQAWVRTCRSRWSPYH